MTDSMSYSRLQAQNGAESPAEDMQAGAQALPVSGVDSPENTPPGNHGVYISQPPQITTPSSHPLSFRFDWYQATLDKEVEPLTALRWGQFLGDSVPGHPRNGYAVNHDFGQAALLYGGSTGEHGVHVEIRGGDVCPELVEYLRLSFPTHRPTRVDVCLDFQDASAWDQLLEIVTAAALKFDVRVDDHGDWLRGKNGRTRYLNKKLPGKDAPTFSARLYEKGHEQRSKKVNPDAPLDWVRLEIEIHPPKHNRRAIASMTPDELARSSRWTRFICDALGTVSARRVRISSRRKKPPVLDSVEHMFRQYRGPLVSSKRDGWMTREEYMQACGDLWDREAFGGLPSSVRASYIF